MISLHNLILFGILALGIVLILGWFTRRKQVTQADVTHRLSKEIQSVLRINNFPELLDLQLVSDPGCKTIHITGTTIIFNPVYIDSCNSRELYNVAFRIVTEVIHAK